MKMRLSLKHDINVRMKKENKFQSSENIKKKNPRVVSNFHPHD